MRGRSVRLPIMIASICSGLLLLAAAVYGASLQVVVVDARNRVPIQGAFVMVGPGKGIPFTGNTATTPANGTVVFNNPNLVGPQTVTAGASTYAYFSVMEAVDESVTLPLSPAFRDTLIFGPKARVHGAVTNIATVNNDGKLDLALILPAVALDNILGTGNVAFEVPPDIADLPIVGQIPFPGNLVMPDQIEYFVLHFAKPNYKIDVPAETIQTMYSVSFRIPIDLILNQTPFGDLIKAAEVRELGVERDEAVGDGLGLNINSDHNLRTELTVQVVGAPNASMVTTVSLGSLPGPSGEELIMGYDIDFGLADTLGSFLMTSSVPQGDIADIANLVVGMYGDSSVNNTYTSGRVDRTPFTLPATRVVQDFYDPPVLSRNMAVFGWNDVNTPGTEPDPTWALSDIMQGPIDPLDASVDTLLVWRIAAMAAANDFALPSLPPEAPGPPSGLPDVGATPADDRLIWDLYIANPQGTLDELILHPSNGVTHFSRRSETLTLNPADAAGTEPAGQGRISARPNPTAGHVTISLDAPYARPAFIDVLDLTGRRVRALSLPGGVREMVWDGADDDGLPVASGVYFIKVRDRGIWGTVKVQRLQ